MGAFVKELAERRGLCILAGDGEVKMSRAEAQLYLYGIEAV